MPWVAAYDSLRTWIAGQLDEADQLAGQALDLALARRSDPDLVFAVIGAQQILFRYLGDPSGVLAILEPVIGQFPDFTPLHCGLGLIYMQTEQPDKCRETFELVAKHDFADHPREGTWLLIMGIMGICCAYLKDERRAQVLYDTLMEYEDRWIATVVTSLGPMSRVLGVLARTLGRIDDAERHFQHALAQTDAVPAPLFHAETCYDYASLLVERDAPGDGERAGALISSARKTAGELSLATLERWITTLERD